MEFEGKDFPPSQQIHREGNGGPLSLLTLQPDPLQLILPALIGHLLQATVSTPTSDFIFNTPGSQTGFGKVVCVGSGIRGSLLPTTRRKLHVLIPHSCLPGLALKSMRPREGKKGSQGHT